MNFADKVVLITGSSSGIGAAAAMKFVKLGANVVLNGRNVKNLKKVAYDCSGENRPLVVPGDVSNEWDNEILMQETLKKYCRLDVLINNAGVLEPGSIENTTMKQYDRIMNTNIRGAYHLTTLAVPHLLKTKGNIVNISSVNGIRAYPNLLAYNISKAAMEQFTRCVAMELAPKGIRCNSVNPGVIVTNLFQRSGMDNDSVDKFIKHSETIHALGRTGTMEEVANAIAFIASDMATFTTGTSLNVDGGRHAMGPNYLLDYKSS